MKLKREDLQAAAEAGFIEPVQIDGLLDFLSRRLSLSQAPHPGAARFSGTHVLYYLGGMLAIGAATVFATLAVEAAGMPALLLISSLYAAAAIAVAVMLERRGHPIPAGIFAALAVALVPLAVYALQRVLGIWSDGMHAEHYRDYHRYIDWRWLVMELATLAAGAAMLRRFRYPFLMMPIAVTLWYMGMDIGPALIAGAGESGGWFSGRVWELRKMISLAFGMLMLLLAFSVDLRTRRGRDYAYWLYLFGLMTFWGALSLMGSGQLAGKLVYLAVNVGLVFTGALLGRRMFAVFGGIGIALVLGDLSWNLFRNSIAFVLVLSLLGFALIGLGLWWSRHEAALSAKLRAWLPDQMRELLDARRP